MPSVNNAAANFPVPAEDMSPNAWRTVVDITLNGTFFVAREFGRRHLAAETPASIINVGASYAWTGGPGFAHSAAAKAGVKNMVETLAVEWGPYGIQVNGLVPGLMPHEDMTDDIQGNLVRTHDKDATQPALRVGQRQELGWAATFLASPFARFISGHTLVVDGANWQRRSLTNPDDALITATPRRTQRPMPPPSSEKTGSAPTATTADFGLDPAEIERFERYSNRFLGEGSPSQRRDGSDRPFGAGAGRSSVKYRRPRSVRRSGPMAVACDRALERGD